MNARLVIGVGAVVSVLFCVAVFLLNRQEPGLASILLRPVSVLLFVTLAILFLPRLLGTIAALLTGREIYGGHLLGSGVVLFSLGFSLPTFRLWPVIKDVCPAGSTCWSMVTIVQMGILFLAFVLMIASYGVPQRSGKQGSPALLGIAFSIGLVFATITYYVTRT